MFLFQIQSSSRLDDFKKTAAGIKIRLETGEDPKKVMSDLNAAYDGFFMGRGKIEKEHVSQLNREYDKVFYKRPSRIDVRSSSQASAQTGMVTDASKARLAKFASDIAAVALGTNPAQFYGSAAKQECPAWYDTYKKEYDNLIKDYKDRETFRGALRNKLGQDGLGYNEKQITIIMSMFAGSGENPFLTAATTMTRTQKAIDGISLLIKKDKLDANVTDSQLQYLFPVEYENRSKSLYNRLIKGGKEMAGAIEELLDSIARDGNAQMMRLVIDANFGENASALKSVITMQQGTYYEAPDNSLKNLQQFYKSLLATVPGANGLNARDVQNAWKNMKASGNNAWKNMKASGNITDELLSSTQNATSDGMIKRGKYDISVIMGFLQAADQDYFKSEAFTGKTGTAATDGTMTYKDNATQYLEAITLNGNAPSAVALSLLANAKTTEYVYKNFKKKPQDIIDITREMAKTAQAIYSQPMGGTFDAVKGTRPTTRQEAVEWFVDRVRTLKDNTLINDIKERYLELGYREDDAYIKLKSLYQLALIGGYDIDSDDIRNFLNSMSTRPTSWNNATDAFNAVNEYVKSRHNMTWQVVEDFYASLMKSPQAYMNLMSVLLEEVLPKDIYSHFSRFGAGANGIGEGEKDLNTYQTDALNVNAQAGSNTGTSAASYSHDISRRSSIDGKNEDNIMREAWLQTQNLYEGQMRIYEMFGNWLDSKITTTTTDPTTQIKFEEITDAKEIDARMKAGGFGGNLFVSFEQRADKKTTDGAIDRDSGKTHVEAIYVRDGRYFKVIGLDKYTTELTDMFDEKVRAQRFVAEHSQWALPFGSLAVGEIEKRPSVAGLASHFTGCIDANAVKAKFADENITLEAGNFTTISQLQTGSRIMIEQDGKNYEVRKSNDGIYEVYDAKMSPSPNNFGFVLAVQTQSETLAGLYAKTVKNDRVAMASARGHIDTGKGKAWGRAKLAFSYISRTKPYKFVDDFARIVTLTEQQRNEVAALKKGDMVEVGGFLIRRERKQYAIYDVKKPVGGFVVSAGYMEYGQDQTNMFNQETPAYTAGGMMDQQTRPGHAIGIVSLLTDKMYATVMGNNECILGKVEASGTQIGSFGAGGFMKWGSDGPRVYMFNGMHSIKNVISTRLAVESIEDQFQRISGRSTIAIGNTGWKIHLYGNDRPDIASQSIKDRWNSAAILTEIYGLTDDINNLKTMDDAGKAAKVKELGSRMLTLLDRLYRLRTGDAFNNTVNQFSVGLEAPDGNFTKFSLANTKTEVSAAGGATAETKDALYILNMTRVGLGDNKAVVFTLGIPATKVDGGELQNVGGVKFNLGQVAFGAAAYDLEFDKGMGLGGARGDFAWVNPSYTQKIRGIGVGGTSLENGGWSGDITVGFKVGKDVIANMKVTKSQMYGNGSSATATEKAGKIDAASIAMDVAIATMNGMTVVLTGAYHHAKQDGEIRTNRGEFKATLFGGGGWTGTAYLYRTWTKAPGAKAYDYNIGLTVQKDLF